jgi:hypothetical protein
LIKDYDKLIGSQTNKHNERLYHCRYCQHGYKRQNLLDKHLERGCNAVVGQSVSLPLRGETIKFKNKYKKFKCPYVIYGDFECLTTKTCVMSKPIIQKTKTVKYQNHKPSGFKLNVVNSITGTSDAFIYRGEDCMEQFYVKIKEIENNIMDELKINKKIIMTKEDEQNFKDATTCYLCDERFSEKNNKGHKVRDHCHLTGKYRGCAHNVCNLKYNYDNFKIPVFFHNLKNYDAHLIISNARNLNTKKRIDVIAQNSEKFISFGYDHLVFKDSFSFLSSSLEKLVKLNKYVEIDGEDVLMDNWHEHFKHSMNNECVKDKSDLDLLTEKGVYPYDYMNSWDKFNETQLPDKKHVYSELTGDHITDNDYDRAQIVWDKFNIKDLGEYHDLYLKTDVLLLTDVFENFRDMCMNYYGLDPAHYYTLPNFAWDAMLLKTDIELEQIHDLDMYEMIEKGKRGGMCQVSHKHAKANNKYMDNYNSDVVSSYISYLDANNLYGQAMTKKLPYKGFEWSNDINNVDDIINYKDEDDGYFLEVDLDYPKELHDLHADYPLAPEIMNVTKDMVSEHSKKVYKHYNGCEVKDENTPKLILNVKNKDKYVLHIKNLKYYLEKGLVLTKIHRCIKFKQREWLKPYIDFNNQKRKECNTDFEKDLFKLMNNAVYGKTMENVREHIDFELVDNIHRLEKCVNSPTYKYRHIINDKLIGIEKTKQVVKLNKPIYIGMAILDLSKLHMYQFYYDVLKKQYGDKIKMIYTDTDSYVIYVETEDLYDDLNNLKEYMDFSDYPKNHKNYNITNKKKLGCFKDEVNGNIIVEFIGLKPKMYAFRVDENNKLIEKKKAKGIPKNVLKKNVTFDLYKKSLESNEKHEVQFNNIRSYNHEINSISCSKTGLTNFDNKRYYLDTYNSLPHGHYSLND